MLQQSVADCAAACLATVAERYGKHVTIPALRLLCGTDLNGTNVKGILSGARQIGYEARAVHGGPECLADIPLPAIAHVRRGYLKHFVVIHAVTSKQVVIADPSAGIVRMKRTEFVRECFLCKARARSNALDFFSCHTLIVSSNVIQVNYMVHYLFSCCFPFLARFFPVKASTSLR